MGSKVIKIFIDLIVNPNIILLYTAETESAVTFIYEDHIRPSYPVYFLFP